jgi:hypothetical protein
MTIIWWGGCGVVLVALLSGCSLPPHTISGAYMARGQQFAELLQITQSPDGQLLGTLNHVALKPDGSAEQFTLNISGTTDGHALTLVGKANEPFAVPTNMSGTIDGGAITVTQPNGMERFVLSTPEAYQTDIQQLGEEGKTIQQSNAQQQQMAQEQQQMVEAENARQEAINNANQRVSGLANALNNYAAMIQAKHDLAPFHGSHEKILAAARHDLEIEQSYPRGSVQRGQVDVRINQLGVQLTQFDIPWGQLMERGHTHLSQFDAAIAQSPCHNGQDQLSACGQQREAEKNYQAAKTILVSELSDVETSLKQDTDEMNRITKEADTQE